MRSARFAVAVLSVSALAVVAFAAPTTKPAKAPRLVQPWSKVADLSDEQKTQLAAIHEEITGKINALKQEEETRCNAVLTEEQRKKLDATLSEEAAAKKVQAADRRKAAKDAASKPVD
ncbi:MAG: hypothetical protein QM770_09765 [Tepidisphaeraceae bacterium]